MHAFTADGAQVLLLDGFGLTPLSLDGASEPVVRLCELYPDARGPVRSRCERAAEAADPARARRAREVLRALDP